MLARFSFFHGFTITAIFVADSTTITVFTSSRLIAIHNTINLYDTTMFLFHHLLIEGLELMVLNGAVIHVLVVWGVLLVAARDVLGQRNLWAKTIKKTARCAIIVPEVATIPILMRHLVEVECLWHLLLSATCVTHRVTLQFIKSAIERLFLSWVSPRILQDHLVAIALRCWRVGISIHWN